MYQRVLRIDNLGLRSVISARDMYIVYIKECQPQSGVQIGILD